MTTKEKNWIIILVCSSPVLLMIDLKVFTEVALLIREPSDTSVAIGVAVISVALLAHYFLFKFFVKQSKKTKTK